MSSAIHFVIPEWFESIFTVPSGKPKAYYHLVYLAYLLAVYIVLLLIFIATIFHESIVSNSEETLIVKIFCSGVSGIVLTVFIFRLVSKSPSFSVWCKWMVGVFFQLAPLSHFCAILTQFLCEFARGIENPKHTIILVSLVAILSSIVLIFRSAADGGATTAAVVSFGSIYHGLHSCFIAQPVTHPFLNGFILLAMGVSPMLYLSIYPPSPLSDQLSQAEVPHSS